jgi:acetyl esterase/lipase
MRRNILYLLFVLITINSYSQKKETVHLWPGKVPGEVKEKRDPVPAESRNDNVLRYAEVTDPAMEIWLADRSVSKKAGVIVCPGGAYRILAYDKEGTEIAAWLNKLGYSAFVLQYRVPDKLAGALQDAQRAIRLVRKNASRWNIDPENIGIMGFSAGGSLSARAGSCFNKRTYTPVDDADSLSARPAFALLIYPGLLDSGTGKTFSPEIVLTKDTSPMFIFQASDDPVGNSYVVLAAALREARLPYEMHIMPKGGHGYGLRPGNPSAEAWPALAENWLSRFFSENQNQK